MVAKRTDHNQAEIVQALRAIGATVTSLAGVGCGCPDLLVGWRDHNFLMEIKNLEGRGDRMTVAEIAWIEAWHGQVAIVYNEQDALSVVYGTYE